MERSSTLYLDTKNIKQEYKIMSKPKVLIVEDDSVVTMDTEKRLKNFGYDVCGKISYAEKTVDIVKNINPDLVLMDIVLKGEMDGIESAKIIQFKR